MKEIFISQTIVFQNDPIKNLFTFLNGLPEGFGETWTDNITY